MRRKRYDRRLERKLAAYGAATTALLAAGAIDAQAQSCVGGTMVGTNCYRDVDPDVTVNTNGGTFDLDFNGDGTAEFRVARAGNAVMLAVDLPNEHGFRGATFPSALASNVSITAGQDFNTLSTASVTMNSAGDYPAHPWNDGHTNRYVGFRLVLDGSTHYGWARFDVSEDGLSVTVKDLAFNTEADEPIVTGFTNLPVELTSFEAVADADAAVLRWQTASETNNAGFEVQRLLDGDWHPLGFVAGHGTTVEAQRYEHRVEALAPGTHRFRLKQVDYDGAFAYSPEVEVAVGVPSGYALSEVYPNPFNPQASFTLAVAQAQAVRVTLHDVLGREVRQVFSGGFEGGQNRRFTVDGTGLPSGVYLVRVTGETFAETRRITLAK